MVSVILAIILVNMAYRLYMKLFDIDAMLINRKTKIALYVVVSLVLFGILGM